MARAKKDVQEIIDQLEAQGWAVTSGKRNPHWKCVAPNGRGVVFMASTPSDYRSLLNTKAHLRRLGAVLK
jgi:hypothetical protein